MNDQRPIDTAIDAELAAIKTCHDALRQLSINGVKRTIWYIGMMYNVEVSPKLLDKPE